jgi:hypothetical protein
MNAFEEGAEAPLPMQAAAYIKAHCVDYYCSVRGAINCLNAAKIPVNAWSKPRVSRRSARKTHANGCNNYLRP